MTRVCSSCSWDSFTAPLCQEQGGLLPYSENKHSEMTWMMRLWHRYVPGIVGVCSPRLHRHHHTHTLTTLTHAGRSDLFGRNNSMRQDCVNPAGTVLSHVVSDDIHIAIALQLQLNLPGRNSSSEVRTAQGQAETYRRYLYVSQNADLDDLPCDVVDGSGRVCNKAPCDVIAHAERRNTNQSIHCLVAASLSIQCLFTAYSLPLHCLFTAYSLSIHCLFTAYSLPIFCLLRCLTVYSLPLHYLLTAYSLPIHCLFTAYSLPIRCLFAAYLLPLHCLFTAYSLPAHCLFTAYSLPHCPFTVYQLPIHSLSTASHCLFTVYSLPIHCLSTAYLLPIRSLFILILPNHCPFNALPHM
jgi:hypothetical protein